MKKTVRIGIVGAGWPGQQHALAVRACPDAVLAGLAEPDDERKTEFVRSYKPEAIYADYEELLGDPPRPVSVTASVFDRPAEPTNSAEQAVYLMEMLDAIYLSSTTGREVPIARA